MHLRRVINSELGVKELGFSTCVQIKNYRYIKPNTMIVTLDTNGKLKRLKICEWQKNLIGEGLLYFVLVLIQTEVRLHLLNN
jgi:hypothetical protein